MEELKVNISEEKELKVSVTDEEELKINVNSIDYIPGYKEAEEERRKNEAERQAYYEQVKSDIANGLFNISGGSTDYNELDNKPSINGVELKGNKTLEELGIDLTNFYTKEEVDDKIPSLENYALKSEIPDVSSFQTEEEVNALISEAIGGIENGSY